MTKVSDETHCTLATREYVDMHFRILEERLSAHEARAAESHEAHQQAHHREHQMRDDAWSKYERMIEERLHQMNQWRQHVHEDHDRFMTKQEFMRIEDAWQARDKDRDKAIDRFTEQWANLQGRISTTGGLIGLLSLVAVFLSVWSHFGGGP